ncbi:MAG TPA: PIN domain-containing protein [Acidimicrobiales bacterium]|nr:PIN domain-containing protein [Acidimicrobiales bacterium]
MFVEIVRLFIVFLATAAGYTLGRGTGTPGAELAGNGAIVGATLGACVGYVSGGIVGRLLRMVMGLVEERVDELHPGRLLAGAVGAACGGGLSTLLALPAVLLLPGLWGWPIFGLVVWSGVYLGWRLTSRKYEDLLALAGLSTRPLVRATPYGTETDAHLVDTSAIIDGRLLAIARAGFLKGPLLVPRFVLDELQAIADAQDPLRRRKGRRGLDLLEALQGLSGTDVHVLDDDVVDLDDVDAKLVALARRLKVDLVTVDEPLQRIAELQGVRCLSLHRLSDGLRPVHVAGEVVRLPITRAGREPGQGVGFLDDGTMVVVADGEALVGREVDARITGNAKTAMGTMLFASISRAGAAG